MYLSRVIQRLVAVLLCLLWVGLSGCGKTNLLGSFEKPYSTTLGQANNALLYANYAEADRIASDIAANTQNSSSDRAKAYVIKGKAQAGLNRLTATELAIALGSVIPEHVGKQLLDVVPSLPVSLAKSMADAFNAARQLDVASLTPADQLMRVFANVVVVASVVDQVMDLSVSPVVAKPNKTYVQVLEALHDANSVSYAQNAVDALAAVDTSSDTQTHVNAIQARIQELETLYTERNTLNETQLQSEIARILAGLVL